MLLSRAASAFPPITVAGPLCLPVFLSMWMSLKIAPGEKARWAKPMKRTGMVPLQGTGKGRTLAKPF